MAGKYSVHQIQESIKAKFGTQKAYADFLGITDQSLSKRIARRSSKFIYEMKQHGVNLDNSPQATEGGVLKEILETVVRLQNKVAKLEEDVRYLKGK